MRADEFLPMNDKTRLKLKSFEKGNQVSLDFMIIFLDRLFNFIVEVASQEKVVVEDSRTARAMFVQYMITQIYERKVQKHYFPDKFTEDDERVKHDF